MTLYQNRSFTVPASAGDKATCDAQGHAFADRKGKCVRCGDQIRPDPYATRPQHDLDERNTLGRHRGE